MALDFEEMILRPVVLNVIEVTKENAIEIINASGMVGTITEQYDPEGGKTDWLLALSDHNQTVRVVVGVGDYLARGETGGWTAILKNEINQFIPYNGTDPS